MDFHGVFGPFEKMTISSAGIRSPRIAVAGSSCWASVAIGVVVVLHRAAHGFFNSTGTPPTRSASARQYSPVQTATIPLDAGAAACGYQAPIRGQGRRTRKTAVKIFSQSRLERRELRKRARWVSVPKTAPVSSRRPAACVHNHVAGRQDDGMVSVIMDEPRFNFTVVRGFVDHRPLGIGMTTGIRCSWSSPARHMASHS